MSNSTKKPLRIIDLTIGKMPGFPSGMKPFEEFSDGINIIAGPNASGKSTTAGAIQKLIWQNDTDRTELRGRAELNGDTWTLQVDSGHKVVQRNGVDDEITGVPAAEDQNRYMLALHKLLTADGKELAKQIIRESVGGYDPEKAAENLSYSSSISTTGIGVYKEYRGAEKTVLERQNDQKEIKADEQKLTDLYKQRKHAEASKRQAEFYDLAVEKIQSEKSFEEIRERKETFPQVLENAHGQEHDRVEEIESELSEAKEMIRIANDEISKNQAELDKLTIPKEGVQGTVLDELETRADRIESLEKEIAELKGEKASLENKRSEVLRRIGDSADPEKLRELNLQDVGDLDQFLQDAHRIVSDKRLAEKEVREFEKEISDNVADPEAVRSGIGALGNWLKEVPERRRFPSWVILVIALLAVLSGVAGYFVPEAGLTGLLIILILAVYGWMELRGESDNQTEKIRVKDFEATGLTPPAVWTADEIKNRLDELISDLREARWQERLGSKLENSKGKLSELESRFEAVNEKADDLKQKLSVLPELPFKEPAGYSELAWFIKAVQNWQAADAELLALVRELDVKQNQFGEELKKVSELIKPYTDRSVWDSAETGAVYKDLKKQEDVRSRAEEEISRQESAIETHEAVIERKSEDLKTLYQKFDLSVGEKDELRKLVDQLSKYNEVKNEFQIAELERKKYDRLLEEHPLFNEEQERLAELTLDEAKGYRDKLLEQSEKLDSLRDAIAGIEARVDALKSGNTLEKALSERQEAVERLRSHYEDNLSKLTGRLLADKLKERMREQNRPKVFKEANRLFNRITRGRYKLEMDEKDEPVFLAYDTVENIGRSLDQLSSGTRIQLLMAVRLAFVETQETSVKLPILADELLANSDDVRAEAIIEALTEISRDGRQVFYFTAQGDEVAKWESYLARNGGEDHKVYYLTKERLADRYKTTPHGWGPVKLAQGRDLPKPELMTYETYGKKLNVPELNPLRDDPEQLHLWYLMDDPQILFNALSSGIEFWGALKSYLNEGGVIEELGEQEIGEIQEKAALLERYLQLYSQGRPQPIDRSVLEESGAISDSFIDAVTEKLKELDGDPAKLIISLRNSEVSGFRTNKIEELEAYLLEKGYLDDRESLGKESITIALQAFISNQELSRHQAERFLKRIQHAPSRKIDGN